MDRQTLALLIPILALAIPVAAIVLNGLQKLARVRLEEARVRAGALGGGADRQIADLREEVAALREELGEVQERLDFAERLLSQARHEDRLPGRPPT
jgi:chromosome segregation ATPase